MYYSNCQTESITSVESAEHAYKLTVWATLLPLSIYLFLSLSLSTTHNGDEYIYVCLQATHREHYTHNMHNYTLKQRYFTLQN